MNFYESVAKDKLKLGDDYDVAGWEKIGPDAVIYKFGPVKILTRGKNKGQRRVTKATHTCAVFDSEIKEAKMKFESDTGKCYLCGGDGQEWRGWNYISGNEFEECRRCLGTGTAQHNAPQIS